MQPSDIVLFTEKANSEEEQQRWDNYSRYVFRGSDLLYKDTAPARPASTDYYADVPERIRDMLAMYEYGDGSFQQKCLNFVRQGKYMEDYEDDVPWYGDLLHYFPVYHDLNIRQLRGYFTWRAKIRKGEFTRTCPAFAYIYLYELLNGIGSRSDTDSFARLISFQKHYANTGLGDRSMKSNLRRWLFEYAVIHRFSRKAVLQFAENGTRSTGHKVAILREPGLYDDEEVFSALSSFAESNTSRSIVISGDKVRGTGLFAEIWRHIAAMPAEPPSADAVPEAEKTDIFSVCFGKKKIRPWHPLANAIYVDRKEAGDIDYELDGCRRYFCHDGEWQEEVYDPLSGSRLAFMALMHAADRRLRTMLKTGHSLHNKAGDDWALPYIDKALEEIRAEEAEAARPKISIDLSGLDKIRKDAGTTRDSLLTDSEIDHDEQPIEAQADLRQIVVSGEPQTDKSDAPQTDGSDTSQIDGSDAPLDELQTIVVRELLAGRPAETLIKENHLMPSVLADSINEALIDMIGDYVIECVDDRLALVEDYIDDLTALTGGTC